MSVHHCETWQMMESAKGGWYCGACGKHEVSAQVIPEAAVEAAAIALDPRTMGSGGALAEKFKAETRAEARRILEAAAPHMLAGAAGEGDEAWDSNRVAIGDNPFSPTP